MVNSYSITAIDPGEKNLSALVRLTFLGPEEEHVALLVDPGRFPLLRRWDEVFDEGVAAVFDLASGEAELLALSFHAGKFTPARAATWLAKRVLKPLLFFPNSGRLTFPDLDSGE